MPKKGHHFKTPFLRSLCFDKGRFSDGEYPLNLPVLRSGLQIELDRPVTLFVGENGTGKSTLLEAIAMQCGFNASGGSKSHVYGEPTTDVSALSESLRLGWLPRVTNGFFMRAESFSLFASYIDALAGDEPDLLNAYGGKSLHAQSHGESFLALFLNRFGKNAIYILDEPEAALSPDRQLAFLKVIHDLEETGHVQIIMATHSPIIMSYPNSLLLHFKDEHIYKANYRDTEHFQTTVNFLQNPERYFKHLFEK